MQFVDIAVKCAKKSLCKSHKHGAVCISGNKVISCGWNIIDDRKYIKLITYDNKIVFIEYKYSRHAEIDAIMKLPKGINYRKITLVVVRDKLELSKPCERCENVMKILGISKVCYSDNGMIVIEKY